MRFDFLEATGTRLAKQFTRDTDGHIHVEQYPLARYFTSTTLECETLEELLPALAEHAERGACLLKGTLAKPLKNERRRGTTTTHEPTSWILLDIDRTAHVSSHDEFVRKCLPDELQNCDYIWQPSSSAIAQPERGLSGHIFMWLVNPVPAPLLREWLVHLNLNNETLADALELSASGKALKYSLDVTTCQNDKLIYIAPPICNYPVDTTDQFTLVHKAQRTALIDLSAVNAVANREKARDHVKRLRQAASLPVAKADMPKVRFFNDTELLENPDPAIVTSIKQDEDFVRLNVNGGDSWAYWHHVEDPVFLYNYKGEPTVRIQDFLPQYWDAIQKTLETEKRGTLYLGVWHRESDTYYTVEFNRATEELSLCRARSKDRLKDFMESYGRSAPLPPPIYRIAFEPQNDRIVDVDRAFINRYTRTKFMRNAQAGTDIPPICTKILRHVFNYDDKCINHFLNWLAFIYQQRKKTKTAWVLQGTEGTGKGLLVNSIIRPTLGNDYVYEVLISQLNDPFNGWKEQNLITLVDESDVGSDAKKAALVNMFKNNITEEQLVIRRMNTDPYEAPSYMNYIFSSNEHFAVFFTEQDRRYNVAPRQETMLEMTDEEVAAIAGELQQWTNFIMSYEVDVDAVRKPLRNEAKEVLMRAAQNSTDRFFSALKEGELEFFFDAYVDTAPPGWHLHHNRYKEIFESWRDCTDETCKVAISDLVVAYQYVNRVKTDISPIKFGRMLAIRGLSSKKMRIDGQPKQGIEIAWNRTPDYSKVVSIAGS